MKLRRRSTGKKPANPDTTIDSDSAIYGFVPSPQKPESKPKRKKFGLFSKSKDKGDSGGKSISTAASTPQRTITTGSIINNEESTPDTVIDFDDDARNLSADSIASPMSTEEVSKPQNSSSRTRIEEELHETLSWARSLIEQLDMAEADSGQDGEAEGTELILPSPEYEMGNDEPATETDADADAEDVNDEINEDVANANADVEEKKGEETDPRNSSMVVEEEEGEGDQQPEPEQQQSQNFATKSAAKILAVARSCTTGEADNCSTLPEDMGEIKNAIGCNPPNLDGMFNERTGSEFLHGLQNVGYTLIYHIAVGGDSWVGRTVNLTFRPGVCSARKTVQPVIEWSTMVGGKSKFVETKTMGLLSIDAIAASTAEDDRSPIEPSSLPIPAKPPTNEKNDVSISMCRLPLVGEEDEFDCFFTITSQDGEIHLFEALNTEECFRIVAGIRYSAQRLSQLVIEGETSVLLSDFYDNSKEPDESSLPDNEVMNRISHAFWDEK